MNDMIELLLGHRSIRKFKPDPITPEQLDSIIAAAQAASTSSNMQAYSVVGVADPQRKAKLAELAGHQRHVEQCPLLLIWCADLHRLQEAVRLHDPGEQVHQNTEAFLLATVDAALAAQNAAVAAESLGLGIVYIGGIRNDPAGVTGLLQLPPLVYPVFGMCVGVPDQQPDTRPRLPRAAVYHSETYSDADYAEHIRAYDETMRAYYARRTGGARATVWSQEMASRTKREALRGHMRDYLLAQGFRLD